MEMYLTVAVLILAVAFFIQGKIRSDIVALCAVVFLLLAGVLTSDEALSGFSSPLVMMMIGLFVVGGAIFRTGLAKMVGSQILKVAGNNEDFLFILIFVVTAFIGCFVSNTGTVALMLPIVVSLTASANMGSERFLMPLAFASSVGGMFTLIGTPPNLVISEELVKSGSDGLSFFAFTPVGFVSLIVSLLVLMPLSKKLKPKTEKKESKSKNGKKTLTELDREYQISNHISMFRIEHGSPIAGQKLSALEIPKKYNLVVTEVRRHTKKTSRILNDIHQEIAGAETVFAEGDIIHVLGLPENAKTFMEEWKLLPIDKAENLQFLEIGIAEVVLIPDSSLVGRTLIDAQFRNRFGVTILGIQRNGKYILSDLKDTVFESRDTLLVQGTWENIGKLSEDQDWIVLGQPLEEAAKVTLDHKMPLAGLIMILMIVSMVVGWIPPVASVLVAAILMVLTGCFRRVEDAYKTINWESIVLIAAMLPMSTALQKTGASALISEALVRNLGVFGPYALLAGIYFTTSLMTMFISNTATAVLLAPIALSAAVAAGMNPIPFLFAVSVGASMCFASPFSTPPNALVMNAGHYRFMDYVRIGLPLQVIIGIIMVFVLPFIFPFK
ncbi:MAG: SLC13 family permease [Fibrobacter sp.]|jgi:di/tricarboxylate transporter|nr:SLC13 family permease [Fibrobacter sp.]